MAVSSSSVIQVICCLFPVALTQSELFECDGSTEYFEIGSRIEVLCANETSLQGALWYRGESSEAFLRLDGGTEVEPEGYNISANGAMVIEDLQLEHEGLYRVTIIDQNLNIEQRRIYIYPKVTMTEEPRVEQCRSSSSERCNKLDRGMQDHTLLCYAEGTRPAANLTWSSLSPTSLVVAYNTYVNGTNSLFTAYSTLKYDPANFTLQLFTCNIFGVPVESTEHRWVYVEGTRVVPDENVAVKNVSGAEMNLECPLLNSVEPRSALRLWSYVHSNGTVEILRHTYPGNNSGSCYSRDNCQVSDDGVLTAAVSYKDEGRYECMYTHSSDTGNVSTDVSRIIVPTPMKTKFEGCDHHESCDLSVARTGSVECSIRGSRPAIKPIITARESDIEKVFLFNYKYVVTDEDPRSGTSDIILTVEYEVEECISYVQLSCHAAERIDGVVIPPSVVNLITDTDECGGRTGLAVFLVLFFLILVAIGIFVIIRWKYVHEKYGKYIGLKPRDDPEGAETLLMNPEPKKDFDEELLRKFLPIYCYLASGKATSDGFERITEFCNENEIKARIMFLEAFLSWIPVGGERRKESGEKEMAAMTGPTEPEDVPTPAPQNPPSPRLSVNSPASSDPRKGSPSEKPSASPSTEATYFTDVSEIAIVLNFLLENQSKEWVALHKDMMNMWTKLVTINKLAARDYLDLLWCMYTAREVTGAEIKGILERYVQKEGASSSDVNRLLWMLEDHDTVSCEVEFYAYAQNDANWRKEQDERKQQEPSETDTPGDE